MTYQANIPTPDVKPKWTIEDVTMDVTEVIGESYPGIFDEGDNLVAYLRRDDVGFRAGDDNPLTLNGLSVESTSGFTHFDRAWCIKVFGIRYVWGLEEEALLQELREQGHLV
ncbi:hypothetical protein [Roseovarius sp.]|uniref:hypothetical protein n=1 Tax=Roseovarius sp. TaxID=1486281 RepID=UPI003BACD735